MAGWLTAAVASHADRPSGEIRFGHELGLGKRLAAKPGDGSEDGEVGAGEVMRVGGMPLPEGVDESEYLGD